MSEEKAEFHPEWTPDCQGKWDYDFGMVHLSCRYWPRGGGFDVFTQQGWEGNSSRPEIKPAASASIVIGDTHIGPYETLVETTIEGDDEAEVKAKVEEWAKEHMEKVYQVLHQHFIKK